MSEDSLIALLRTYTPEELMEAYRRAWLHPGPGATAIRAAIRKLVTIERR